jgi:cysteine-rich repeat protein
MSHYRPRDNLGSIPSVKAIATAMLFALVALASSSCRSEAAPLARDAGPAEGKGEPDGSRFDGADAGEEPNAAAKSCGNGTLDPMEQCDDGNQNEEDGCTSLCEFTCSNDADCDDLDECNGLETCSQSHRCVSGSALEDGEPCGPDMVCRGGMCVGKDCGDGSRQPSEECDDGNEEDSDGCTRQCRFTCVSEDPSRNCANECDPEAVCDDDSHTCIEGEPLPDDSACDGGYGYCRRGVCTPLVCDGRADEPEELCEALEQLEDGEDVAGAVCDSIPTMNAIHMVVSLSWGDPSGLGIVTPGSGDLHLWLKFGLLADEKSNPDGSYDLTATTRLCGRILPDIEKGAIAGGGLVQSNIPDATWDHPDMPETVATGTVGSNRINAAISIELGGLAIGLTMTDLVSDSWPDTGQDALPDAVDADGDGKPGITAVPNGTSPYTLPAADLFQTAFADRLYIVTRVVMQLEGTRTSCTAASGTAAVYCFDNHIVGCRLQDGSACDAAQAQFIDDNRTIYDIGDASYEMARVADDVTCADVRAAFPQPGSG